MEPWIRETTSLESTMSCDHTTMRSFIRAPSPLLGNECVCFWCEVSGVGYRVLGIGCGMLEYRFFLDRVSSDLVTVPRLVVFVLACCT